MSSIFYRKFIRLSGRQVVNLIEKFLKEKGEPLTEDQKKELHYYWGMDSGIYGDLNLPFKAYTWDVVKYKGKPLVRLTVPVFVIFVILMTLIVRPIHWILTGSWWFGDSKSKLESFINKWWINMFGE